MINRKWTKWLKNKNYEEYDISSFVGYKDGYFTVILEGDNSQLKLIWEHIYSYMETDESYREDCWLEDFEEYWPFYITKDSTYLDFFKSTNEILKDEEIYHFIIIGEEVIDVISSEEPEIIILEKENNINTFDKVFGDYIFEINGQSRFGYSLTETEDFHDIPDFIEADGVYRGSVVRFFDYETGQVFQPFELMDNVLYSSIVYIDDRYLFLQADFNAGLINLYEYFPGKYLNLLEKFNIADLNLYNLQLIGHDLYLISSDDNLEIYYPITKTIKLEANESLMFIRDDKLFISAWIEEGWDDNNWEKGPDYQYYEKMIIKDFDGNVISEKKANLHQSKNGQWWIA